MYGLNLNIVYGQLTDQCMDQPPWFGTHMVCGLIERFNHVCVWLPDSRCNSSLAIQNHIVIPINKSSLKYIKWCLSVAKPIIHTFSLWPKTFCFQVVCLDIRFLWTWYLSLEGFFFFSDLAQMSLGDKDELIRFLWSKVKDHGNCDLTSVAFLWIWYPRNTLREIVQANSQMAQTCT